MDDIILNKILNCANKYCKINTLVDNSTDYNNIFMLIDDLLNDINNLNMVKLSGENTGIIISIKKLKTGTKNLKKYVIDSKSKDIIISALKTQIESLKNDK